MATKSTRDAEMFTRDAATVESIPFPKGLTMDEAAPGTVATMLLDDDGKLYRIDGQRSDVHVNVTREDGKKFYMYAAELQATTRKFPVLPDYIPVAGDMVHVKGVRGLAADAVLFVGSVTKGKAKCWILDNTKRHVSLPFANLTKVEGEVTVAVKG